MHYDQSWMGDGLVGALQAGAISAVAALLVFGFFNWRGRRHGWSLGRQIGWSFLLAALLTASGDLADLLYFNYAQLQSLQLLRAELALVHDPEGMGTRVMFELSGVVLGIYVGWLLCHYAAQRWLRRR
jgi:hypothetical protein